MSGRCRRGARRSTSSARTAFRPDPRSVRIASTNRLIARAPPCVARLAALLVEVPPDDIGEEHDQQDATGLQEEDQVRPEGVREANTAKAGRWPVVAGGRRLAGRAARSGRARSR